VEGPATTPAARPADEAAARGAAERADGRSLGARTRSRLRAWHRDVGYLCAGLVVVYAISGVAVNHHHDWDASYGVSVTSHPVGAPAALLDLAAADPAAAYEPGALARERQAAVVAALTAALGRSDRPYTAFWTGPDRLSLYFGKADFDVVEYSPAAGTAHHSLKGERPILRPMNWLHLNEGQGVWTWVADAFAVALFFLAVSGVFLVRGRRGLRGRGGVLVALGILLPVLAALLLR
jgi:hypothetical protein